MVFLLILIQNSLDDTDVKKAMFRTLAQRQIEKARASRHQVLGSIILGKCIVY